MIIYVKGDLFKSPAKVLVNTVNTVGVMGAGIAKEFKKLYPNMFNRYQQFCEEGLFKIGSLWIYKTDNKFILNFPTKDHWRNPSKTEYIKAGLEKFIAAYSDYGISSIAFPHIGCGNGELHWEREVHPLMIKYLKDLPIDIFIYDHVQNIKPEHKDIETMKSWLRSNPQSLAFIEFWDDIVAFLSKDVYVKNKINDSSAEISLYQNGQGTGIRISHSSESFLETIKNKLTKLLPSIFIKDQDIIIRKEAMLSLWQTVRERGFCAPEMMPSGIDSLWNYLFPLLSKLDYLIPIEFTNQNNVKTICLQFFKPDSYLNFGKMETSCLAHTV